MPFLSALGAALGGALVQLAVLLGPLAVAVVALNLSSSLVMRQAIGLLGPRAFLCAFGWLGTAVHELSHALFCLLFGHRVLEVRLFDPGASDGSLGYVRHAYNPWNPLHQLGNLFIAVAPVVVGAALLALGGVALLGGDLRELLSGPGGAGGEPGLSGILAGALGKIRELGALALGSGGAGPLRVTVFCYLALAIGGFMSMSREDALGALPGLVTAALLLFAANLAAALLSGATLTGPVLRASPGLGFAWSVMLAAAALNLVAGLALLLLRSGLRLLRRG